MKADPETEALVAVWYLRDKASSILASAIQPHHFRALPKISPMWRHARDMSDAGREWLPMDFDRDGYLDTLGGTATPMRMMVDIAERRMLEVGAVEDFREGARRLLGGIEGMDAREISAEARRLVGEFESSGPVKAETFADAARRLAGKFVSAMRDPDSAPARTIPCPTPVLDEALGGWRRGKLHLVGAITSSHKTTFARKALEVAAKAGHRCLYWTAEDSNDDIAARTLASNIKGLQVSHLETMDADGLANDQRAEVVRGFSRVIESEWAPRIRMVDMPNPSLAQVTGVIRQQASKPLDFIVFDFLQRITRHDMRESEASHWDRCTAELRELAKVLDVAIVCPVQPTQEGTKRVEDGKPLRVGDLKGGSSIAQNAYGVLTLFVDEQGGGRFLDVHTRKWKGASKHKFRLWVSGGSDDLGDVTNR